MSTPIADLAILRAYFLDQAAILAEVGARMWAGTLTPPDTYQPADGAGIVFNRRGGDYDESGEVIRGSYTLKAYGATPQDAEDTYQILLTSQYRTSKNVMGLAFETTGQHLDEQVTGWHFVMCHFRAQVRN